MPPVEFALECKFPDNLNAAVRSLDLALGNRIIENQRLLKLVEDAIIETNAVTAINEIEEIFESLMRQGEGTEVRNFDDLSTTYGLPVFAGFSNKDYDPTLTDEQAAINKASQQEADEKAIFDAGGVLHDNVFYISGVDSTDPAVQDNVEILSKVFSSVGQDLEKTAEVYDEIQAKAPDGNINDGSFKPILFQSKLVIEKLPAIKNGTESVPEQEVRDRFGFPNYIDENDVRFAVKDNITYVLRKEFVSQNLQKAQILKQFGVANEDVITETYHIGKKEIRPERVREVLGLGYNAEETGVIFRFKRSEFPESSITTSLNENQASANATVKFINFFAERVFFVGEGENEGDSAGTTAGKLNFQKKLTDQINNLIKAHRQLISDLFFSVNVIRDVTVLNSLQFRHSEEAVRRLLQTRPEIVGIDFNKSVEEIDKEIDKMIAGATNYSSKVSANYMKRLGTTDTFNSVVITQMYAELDSALVKISLPNPVNTSNILAIRLNLTNYSDLAAEAVNTETLPVVPYTGQPADPSAIMAKEMDIDKSYQWQADVNSIKEILPVLGSTLTDAAADIQDSLTIGGSLIQVLEAILAMFEKVMKYCKKVMDQAAATFLQIETKLQSFAAKIYALMGGGSFDASLLNCVSLKFEFPDFLKIVIENLLCFLASLINGILGLSLGWIADLIQAIICIPISVINALLGVLNNVLPKCISFSIELGDEIIALLQKLKLVGDRCSSNISTMGSGLGALSLTLANLGDKLNGFGQSANCAQPVNDLLGNLPT